MKKYLFLMLALVIVSCSDQMLLDEARVESSNMTPVSEFQTLLEKARWGDGQAYLKLADCYRDGKGVKSDFIGETTIYINGRAGERRSTCKCRWHVWPHFF